MQEFQLEFLKILADFINERPKNENHYSDEIKRLAQLHQLSAIVSYQSDVKNDDLFSLYLSQISNYANRKKAMRAFEAAVPNVAFAFFKGASVADVYPVPALRSMGDVDVLIHSEDHRAIYEKLTNAGFVHISDSDIVSTFQYNKIEFEVHSGLVHLSSGNKQYAKYFKGVWEYVAENKITWNYHVLYLLFHLSYHLKECGAGFRQFIDIAVITRKVNIDWKWVLEETRAIGLDKFLIKVLACNERWFGVKSPFVVNITDEEYDRITRFVFENGVFGFENEINLQNEVAKIATRNKLHPRLARVKYIWKQLFPSYYVVQEYNYCKYLKGRPFLLPVAWFHRFFKRIFNKKIYANMMENLDLKNDKINDRLLILDSLGL